MVFIAYIICAVSCLAATKTQNHGTSEDLVAEYYTTTVATTDQFTKQDEDDAATIWNSDRKEDVIASIVMYRDKIRRYAITQKMLDKITGYRRWRMQKRYWIVDTRTVQEEPSYNATRTFQDLVYGLTYDESLVLSQYLENFFSRKDETRITIGMVLAKDLSNVIATYDKNHESEFADERNDQRKPFKFILRAWVKFEKLMGLNKTTDVIIDDSVNDHHLNHDLADTYSSLARYIKDKYKYITGLSDKYSDGKDQWAAWIMCIAVVLPEEWPKVDDAFKKSHKGDSLSKFILQKLTTDKVMAETMALAVDSKFIPTTFSKKQVPGDLGQPAAALPAVPPTVSAPAPPAV